MQFPGSTILEILIELGQVRFYIFPSNIVKIIKGKLIIFQLITFTDYSLVIQGIINQAKIGFVQK